MPDHDAVIVGAGPVGLLLACLLARRGIDVVVCDARDGADDRSRAIGIHPPGAAALDAAGIGEEVREEALALEGGEVICSGRVLASVSFAAGQEVLLLPQQRTDALLRQRLSALADEALQLGRSVDAVHDDGRQVRVSAGGTEMTASFVVAADGVRSGIRQWLGIGWQQHPGQGWYAMVDIPDGRGGPRAQLRCEPAGLVESFPLPRGERRWVVSDPERMLGDADAFAQAVRARTGIGIDVPADIEPALFRARQHRAARLASGRIVLVGDAAHETSPIGGQGMNLGWIAAQRLAAAIEHALRSGEPEFSRYERDTLLAAARAQRRSSFYMAMGRPARGPKLLARNAVIRMLGRGPLRARTADMVTMRG